MRTKKHWLALLSAVIGAVGAFAAPAGAAEIQQAASQNWSGYVAAAGSSGAENFSAVSGSWIQPSANCTNGGGSAAFGAPGFLVLPY